MDLELVQVSAKYDKTRVDFHDVIKNALITAKPDKTRRKNPFERAKLVVKTFEDIPKLGIPRDIADLISSYVVDRPGMDPKSKAVRQIINGIIGTSPENERIGEIVNLYLLNIHTRGDESSFYTEFGILYDLI